LEIDQILSAADLDHLRSRGISREEALAQLSVLRGGAVPPDLDRPAVVGDGISALDPATLDSLLPAFDESARAGDVGFFVPASGAASRMFAGPRQYLAGQHPDPSAEEERLRRLAQAPVVARNLWKLSISPEDCGGVARALVEEPPVGYGWASRPKAFVPFHEDPEESFPLRIPLVEQVAEAAQIVGAGSKGVIHFTLPEEWPLPEGFNDACRTLGRRHGGDVVAGASVQSPSTDTLSTLADGSIARDAQGRPALRAGGHGSLLGNLAMTPGRVVLVKNIDNIQPDSRREVVVPWRRRLGAFALALRSAADLLLERGDSAPLRELAVRLGVEIPTSDTSLLQHVDRPLRVAGMVPNVGEPGGGPFWVKKPGGDSLEIVEQSEVAPEQAGLLKKSTHFNPVEMACCFRKPNGELRDLAPLVDPSRSFLSSKPVPGGVVRVLERPGLWNGSMSGWWTVFLELPLDTFLPAKTIHDLAHPWRVGKGG
jgi:hypothetical protein